MIDGKKGISIDMEHLLRRAIVERVKPTYAINIDGSSFLMLPSDGEMAYQSFVRVIGKVNAVLNTCQDKLLGDIQIHPEKGSCAFSCTSYDWAFTLTDFAKFYAPMFGLNEKKTREKLWGDNFYDERTREWTSKSTGSPSCKRGFVMFCYEPVKEILECCMKDNAKKLCSLLKQYGIKLKASDERVKKEYLLKEVMQTWMPASLCFLKLISSYLPSPAKAQIYRVENLYRGPLNDAFATAIRKCDPSGPLILYIAKMIPASDSCMGLFALGRVFSGELIDGMKIRLLDHNDVPSQGKDLHVGSVESSVSWVETEEDSAVVSLHGNSVCFIGLGVCTEDMTITGFSEADACAIGPTKILTSPYVRAADRGVVTLEEAGAMCGKEYHVPYNIYNELYLHQREAIVWLWSIHCMNSGAILADDMGLGKTREVAVFVAGLLHSSLVSTVLIIAPPTVVDEWQPVLELAGVSCRKYLGAKDKTNLQSVVKNGGVLLTSYDIYRLHLGDKALDWEYVFLDEGHHIKNSSTKLYKSLRPIKSCHKIIITGTPIQNNLLEFHTIMDFCNPGLLGNVNYFKNNFIYPIDRGKYRDASAVKREKYSVALKEFKKIIETYVLRRTKQLLKDQGRLDSEKQEILVWLRLSAPQIKLYRKLVVDQVKMALEEKEPLLASRIAEDICNHPQLLLNTYSEENSDFYKEIKERVLTVHDASVLQTPESSSKLMFLTYLVSKFIEEKHKVLIFAQSPRMLEIIESALNNVFEEGSIIRMDGTTTRQERRRLIQNFQESHSSPLIFLITTKVGGVGITLTKASRVIIFDPSKNPSDDDQSVDRAYRIGQHMDVLVYRLATCGTIEEYRYRQKILKGETSCSVLGAQCKSAINKQERNVLSLPPRGFGYCQTQNELATIYGDEGFSSDLRLDLEFVKRNKSVVGLTNHGRLFSLKDDLLLECSTTDGTAAPPEEWANKFEQGAAFKSCGTSIETIKDRKPIDKEKELQGTKAGGVNPSVKTIKTRKPLDEEKDDKKEKLMMHISSPVLLRLMTGKEMDQIQNTSGAVIKRLSQQHSPSGKQCIEISGYQDQVKMAREMILKIDKRA